MNKAGRLYIKDDPKTKEKAALVLLFVKNNADRLYLHLCENTLMFAGHDGAKQKQKRTKRRTTRKCNQRKSNQTRSKKQKLRSSHQNVFRSSLY